jgi:hypothetical protein
LSGIESDLFENTEYFVPELPRFRIESSIHFHLSFDDQRRFQKLYDHSMLFWGYPAILPIRNGRGLF